MTLNKKQRYGTIAGAMFAAALVATLALVPAMDQQAFAKKPLDDPNYPNAERLIGINLIGLPKGDSSAPDGKCIGNNSNNVYTVRGQGGQHIYWDNTTTSDVEDHCTEKVDGSEAIIKVDADDVEPGDIIYTVRMLGKPGGELKFCTETQAEFDAKEHCVIGDETTKSFLRNGGSPIRIANQLFTDKNEDIVWHSYTNLDFRIAHIDVWYVPSS